MNKVESFSKFESQLRDRLPARWRGISSRTLWLAAGGAAIVLILILRWLLSGLGGSNELPPPPVRVAVAQTRDVPILDHTIGTVLANATVQVKSLVDGQLLSASFKEGQLVKAGDVLFQIDPKPFEDALLQAQAAFDRDQALLKSSQTDLGRYSALAKRGFISAQQRDQTAAQVKSLAGTVASDQAAIHKAKLDLDYAQIRSPIDGKTGPILIQPGNIIKAQDANPLVVITQIQPVKVSFALPQTDLPRLQDRLRENTLVVTLTYRGGAGAAPATPGKTIAAHVDFISNAVDEKTGTIELRATYDNPDLRLVPGELVDVAAQLDVLHNAVVVPRDAVNTGQNGQYIFIIDRNNLAQMRDLHVLYEDETIAAIGKGVAAGERVVTDGQIRLTSGVPVTIVPSRGEAP
jgi:membrane fusion protein, multidrug efflux system